MGWLGMMAAIVGGACGGSAPVVEREVVQPEPTVVEPGLPNAQGKDGVVFAPDGKPLELRVLATGASVEVMDGTPLKLIAEQSGQGMGRADAEVEVGGQQGILPNAAVLVGERLTVSPDGKLAVFVATRECEPDCRSQAWLIHRDGRRLLLTDSVAQPTIVFSPDGFQVALAHRELWLVQVTLWKVFDYKEFAAPAFAPDGALFVRSHLGSDSVLRLFQGGQVTEVASVPGDPSRPDPAPVTFEDGGKTVVAVFARRGGDKTVRTAR